MTYQHVQEVASLQGDLGQPLIGVIAEEQGHEVVHYFTEEQEADRVMVQNTTEDALALAGVWSDLEWDELEKALDSIRHESHPTPPLYL
jgi:DNA/RNA-binding domain of Phe-tRNA-synthetase-like protein